MVESLMVMAKRRSKSLAKTAGRTTGGRLARKEHTARKELWLLWAELAGGVEEVARSELKVGEAEAKGNEGLLRAGLAGRVE